MAPTERGNTLKGVASLVLLFSLISLSPVEAGTSALLTLLKDKDFPWFGTTYTTKCPDPEAKFHSCFNPGGGNDESILERAGFGNVEQLKVTLKVTFSAPAEQVGVCASHESMPSVEPFELNANGQPLDKLEAENFRKMPDVSWPAKPSALFTLIFYDVGFFKIRGWFYNISNSGTGLKGWTIIPYYPPANPTNNTNPILILVLEQSGVNAPVTDEIMSACVETYYSKENPTPCREKVNSILSSGYTLVGAQVFYTDGNTLFEKFRACTESYVCRKECRAPIAKAAATFMQQYPGLISFAEDKLDFYINLRFTGMENKNLKLACCTEPQPLEKYEFRPIVGDKAKVPSIGMVYPEATGARMWLEIGGSEAAFYEKEMMYSLAIVDPQGNDNALLPWGHYYIANFKYPDALSGRVVLKNYEPPAPPTYNHSYIMFLMSHEGANHNIPRGACLNDPAGGPSSACWNLNDLPGDHFVRGVSWFDASLDEYGQEFAVRSIQAACSDLPIQTPCISGAATLESNPAVVIAVTHEVLPSEGDAPATTAPPAEIPVAATSQPGDVDMQTSASEELVVNETLPVETKATTTKTVAVVAVTTKEPIKSSGESPNAPVGLCSVLSLSLLSKMVV